MTLATKNARALVFSLISLTKAFISVSGMAEPATKKEKVCHSCGLDDQGQSTLLDADGAAAAFAELPPDLWTLEDKRLTRKFTAKNFLQAVAFVNAVAPRAEINRETTADRPSPAACPRPS